MLKINPTGTGSQQSWYCENFMKLIDFERIFMCRHVLASRSRWIYFQQKKMSEMKFSDKVDITNVQVCCPTPSRLGERVGQRPSEIALICSY